MSEQSEEEARRRKIILDAETSGLATHGIRMAANGELTGSRLRRLIALDEHYIAEARRIMGESDTEDDFPDSPAAV